VSADPACYILDSYALLVYLGDESGKNRVRELLGSAARGQSLVALSLINLGEVLYITEKESGLARAQEVVAMTEQLPLEIVPATREAVFLAASVKARYPVACADAFAVAAARSLNGVLLTGDPEFEAVKELVEIKWMRYA
jgi:predicted nucleic acid-binding protein